MNSIEIFCTHWIRGETIVFADFILWSNPRPPREMISQVFVWLNDRMSSGWTGIEFTNEMEGKNGSVLLLGTIDFSRTAWSITSFRFGPELNNKIHILSDIDCNWVLWKNELLLLWHILGWYNSHTKYRKLFSMFQKVQLLNILNHNSMKHFTFISYDFIILVFQQENAIKVIYQHLLSIYFKNGIGIQNKWSKAKLWQQIGIFIFICIFHKPR